MRVGTAAARQYYTNSGAHGWTHKISTDIRPIVSPFNRGHSTFWPKFRLQSSLDRRIKRHFIENPKQICQGPMVGLSPYQTWVRSVPQPWEPLAQWVSKRVKVGNFLYILRSSGRRRVQRHQCYTACWGRSCCKRTTVPYLPIRPLHFTGGTQRVKVENFFFILRSSGPRRVHRHQCYATCWGRSCCKILPCHISQFAPTFHRGQKSAAPQV